MTAGGWPSIKGGMLKPSEERRVVSMTMDILQITGVILAIFLFGVTVGKLVEKVERYISKKEDGEHIDTNKNDRR